jgi:DNA-binding NarL/FixJ family response regulator
LIHYYFYLFTFTFLLAMLDGILLCDDLIFTSRIDGTAKALGLTLRVVKIAQDVARISVQSPPRCVILDLNAPGLAIDDLMRELAELTPKPFVVGYGSHVDTATLKRARDAGCDVVWPRSKFVDELAAALPLWFQEKENAS